MKVPLSWLREYVDAPAAPEEAARLLLQAGVGVEAIEGDVLDLEITSNRADLLSILGVAREVGVLLGRPVRVPAPRYAEGARRMDAAWSVSVAALDLCPRYTARAIAGVRIGPSPDWMARRLEASGIRPINNVVDVTNYVLLESGQPLHAFDARRLKGGRVVVRRAAAGEKITALDGREYALSPDMLVIADAERPVAIAGVMGGRETEIGPDTADVLLESAQFDPVSVRRTARRLGLSTESSYRFERGVDYDGVEWASRRAVQLILETAGGAALEGVLEAGGPRPVRPVARVRPARISRVLGMEVPPARVRQILESLGCSVAEREGAFEVAAPPGRRDLRLEADYIEEVARVQGYDAVPCDTRLPQAVPVDPPEEQVREAARSTLAGLGAYEALTWSFAAAGEPNRAPFWTDGPLVPLRDPQGQVDRTLRASLAPGLLGVLETNESYKEPLRPVFEIARIYRKEAAGYGEKTVLGVAAPGDPLAVKGLLERLFERLGIALELRPRDFPFLVPGASAEVVLGGKTVGYVGLAAPELSGLRSAAGVAEIDFEALVPAARLARPYREFNRRPPVERDLSVVLSDGVTWKEVEAVVREAAPATLERLRFLSEYRGKPIPPGHKGWAFSMLFRAADRTLTSEEADAAVQAVLRALESRLGARLR
ncbi:MAG TPA: phenylalanine--tRNA ligase subunit beta [Planctomycetota bacterium]|nr:phenylalanine--tRNA ligase subunit beta [Planctomycetota bacterium]